MRENALYTSADLFSVSIFNFECILAENFCRLIISLILIDTVKENSETNFSQAVSFLDFVLEFIHQEERE